MADFLPECLGRVAPTLTVHFWRLEVSHGSKRVRGLCAWRQGPHLFGAGFDSMKCLLGIACVYLTWDCALFEAGAHGYSMVLTGSYCMTYTNWLLTILLVLGEMSKSATYQIWNQ